MLRVSSQQQFRRISEFTLIENRKVGCGSFGTVKLARHRNTCRMYALKVIDLSTMPSEAEVRLVEREIRLHSQFDHPHLIKLWDTLLEDDSIYMVMEYAEQGNLFAYQSTKRVFGQPEAFKILMQTLRGLQYLHSHNVIHRDIKPENLLLDSHGNVKICDFGWAAEDIHAKRTTFCGTYQYMAPEMLFKAEYDYHVDIWALGVLLYEMLHGYAPFKGKSTTEVKEAMLAGTYDLDPRLSDSAKQLIRSILQFQPERRPSLQQIAEHPWALQMEAHLNNYLTVEGAVLPQEVQSKIGGAPGPGSPEAGRREGKRRKNNSLNFEQAAHNININLQINNYSIVGKHRPKNYHSQEKDLRDSTDCYALKGAVVQSAAAGSKMQPVTRSQLEVRKWDTEGERFLEKKPGKSSKLLKEVGSLERRVDKKKGKLRRSQMEMHDRHDKHPVRFNTEANEDCIDHPKLKKAAASKAKMLVSNKSALRLHKG